jgi:disease resistance protein RPM1
MNSVLDKLTRLKNHPYPTDGFSIQIENLKKDLLGLKEDFCDKVAWRWATDKQVKVCMKQVRELVFEIEDWIDQKPETNMLDPSSIEDIEYFKTEIIQARGRFTWYYGLLKKGPTESDLVAVAPSKIPNNPGLLVEEKPCHGLLHGTRDDLVKHLTDEKEEMLKVVSVVGMEGIGKTTIANEVFSELQRRRQFECQAFVSVGPRTPMREILNDILHQIIPESRIFQDVQQIINQIREYLCTKRYLQLHFCN